MPNHWPESKTLLHLGSLQQANVLSCKQALAGSLAVLSVPKYLLGHRQLVRRVNTRRTQVDTL